MYDYREEGKHLRFHHIGTTRTYRELLRRMISRSDTTATDMVVRIAGQDQLNQRIAGLNIPGLGEITSIGELDRIVYANRHDDFAQVPAHAFEPSIRDRNRDFLIPFHMTAIPEYNDSTEDVYKAYYRWGLNSATPRAMGKVAERLAEESLLTQCWKNDILREEIFSAGREGDIGGAVPAMRLVDTKGGSKYRVRCELGVVYNEGTPEAVIGVFTQKLEIPGPDARSQIQSAANLAYKALGFTHTIPSPSTPTKGLVFTEPGPGQLYEPEVQLPIKWKSGGINGPLTVQLVCTDHKDDDTVIQTLSSAVIDVSEWHSFTVPDDVPPVSNCRFKLTSNDDSSIIAYSNYFALRGVIGVAEPHLGQVIQRGETPTVKWATRGVTGDLTVELVQGETKQRTLSTVAIDDGEWHSWTVSESRQENDNYRIRVASNDGPKVVGLSPPFTIGGRIGVTAPNRNTSFISATRRSFGGTVTGSTAT